MEKRPDCHPQDIELLKADQLSAAPEAVAISSADLLPTPEIFPASPELKSEPSGRKKERSNGKR